MNEVRIVVKFLLGQVKTYFEFVSFKPQIKVGLNTEGKICPVCTLLQNAQTYLYGNKVSEYFNAGPSEPEEQFDWKCLHEVE